jgi:hypothetical protein
MLAVVAAGFSLVKSNQDVEGVETLSDKGRYKMVQFQKDAPPLYPWLLKKDSTRADWLGIRYENRIIHEPVNVVICDGFSANDEEAEAKLFNACTQVDYLDRYGHSSDYLTYVNRKYQGQFPWKKKHSFSDKVFLENNNHGRIFGPIEYKGKRWFFGAFSREKVHVDPVGHYYVSFNQARDNFVWKLDAGGAYKVKKYVNLKNVIIDSPFECSGDHDGILVYLEAVR